MGLTDIRTVHAPPEPHIPATLTNRHWPDTMASGTARLRMLQSKEIPPMNTCRRFRELLSKPGIIRSLGAHDVFTARLIEAAGLETAFLGGFGTSASLLGLPDVGFITLS